MAPRCCSPAARVVTVASLLGHVGRITLDDPNFARRRYNPASAYAQSKLANLLFARELHRRLAGTSVSSVAAHPGYSTTGLVSTMARAYPRPVRLLAVPGARVADLFGQAVRTGVLPQLYASGHPGRVRWPRPALDTRSSARLWELTADLTGITPDPA